MDGAIVVGLYEFVVAQPRLTDLTAPMKPERPPHPRRLRAVNAASGVSYPDGGSNMEIAAQ
jgi:hypothetical protein